jgi:hypothetical protein
VDKLVKVPRGQTLLEVLEEKYRLPVTVLKYADCASCLKPLPWSYQPTVVLKAAPDNWRFPILFFCPLCKSCTVKYYRGGQSKVAVVNAFWEFVGKEASQ